MDKRIMQSHGDGEWASGANASPRYRRHYFAGEGCKTFTDDRVHDIKGGKEEDPMTDGASDDDHAASSLIVFEPTCRQRSDATEQISRHGTPIRLRRSMKNGIRVRAFSCILFGDDKAREDVEKERTLIPLACDEQVMVDRFDIRNLLDTPQDLHTISNIHQGFANSVCTSDEEQLMKALDWERFRDIEPERFVPETTSVTTASPSESKTTTDSVSTSSVRAAVDTSVDFVAPFSIPEHIVTPQKWSKHLKIAHTARKVQQSPHLEVLLRVRQKDNPAFSFLFDDDQLHPYYQFLKERAARGDSEWPDRPPEDNENKSLPENILGIEYSDSDSEDKNEGTGDIPNSSSKDDFFLQDLKDRSEQISKQIDEANHPTTGENPNLQQDNLRKLQLSIQSVNEKLNTRIGRKRRRWDTDGSLGPHELEEEAMGETKGNEYQRGFRDACMAICKRLIRRGDINNEHIPQICSLDESLVESLQHECVEEEKEQTNVYEASGGTTDGSQVSLSEEEIKRQRRLARAKMMQDHFRVRKEIWSGKSQTG